MKLKCYLMYISCFSKQKPWHGENERWGARNYHRISKKTLIFDSIAQAVHLTLFTENVEDKNTRKTCQVLYLSAPEDFWRPTGRILTFSWQQCPLLCPWWSWEPWELQMFTQTSETHWMQVTQKSFKHSNHMPQHQHLWEVKLWKRFFRLDNKNVQYKKKEKR